MLPTGDQIQEGEGPCYAAAAAGEFGSESKGNTNTEEITMIPSTPESQLPESSVFGNGSGKLTVVVPTLLVDKFRAIAGPNSRNNIETIGILGGKLAKNK